jgi:hypothetical protein
MSELMVMFCDLDDFCKGFDPLDPQRLRQDGQRQRGRQGQLGLSEIMPIIVSCHHRRYVAVPQRPYVPAFISYSRLVERRPRARGPLGRYLPTRKGRWTGIPLVDSTPLAGCQNKRRGGNAPGGGMLVSRCT